MFFANFIDMDSTLRKWKQEMLQVRLKHLPIRHGSDAV